LEPLLRKRRTRNHIIADLSANYVERHILLCGHTVERVIHDYGVDLIMTCFDTNGEVEAGQVFIQLKATDYLTLLDDGETISQSVLRSDLETWLEEAMPVILIVYNAPAETAYWVYIQAYFERLSGLNRELWGENVTVHLNRSDTVHSDAVRQFVHFKNRILTQVQGVIQHHEDSSIR
jgi:hypothetical protein